MAFKQTRPVGICPICRVKFGTREHAVLCGEHSNIPKCCTAFFLNPWTDLQRRWTAGDAEAEKTCKNYLAKIRRAKAYWEYIPCPECLRGLRSQPIRTCNCYVGFTKPKATPPKLEYLKGHKRPPKSSGEKRGDASARKGTEPLEKLRFIHVDRPEYPREICYRLHDANEALVASASLYRSRADDVKAPKLHISDFKVEKAFRGQGVGRAFLARILAEHPGVQFSLTAIPFDAGMDYAALERFYESFGFRKVTAHDMVRPATA